MIGTLGPVVVYDTQPSRFQPDRLPSDMKLTKAPPELTTAAKDKGNQATWLFFPIFAAFMLALFATLSVPIIGGMSAVTVDMGTNGSVILGGWGWCASGVPDYADQCLEHEAFHQNLNVSLADAPDAVRAVVDLQSTLSDWYLLTYAVWHALAACVLYVSLIWSLTASGSWKTKEQYAYGWTRGAFHMSGASALVVLIAWALELGMLTRIQAHVRAVDPEATVKPGATIIMMLFALLLPLGAYFTRLAWGQFQPRPEWTVKGYTHSDFHDESKVGTEVNPHSAALPPSDESPPTWESLNIDDAREIVLDDKGELAQTPQTHVV
ncbi:hypothetical protein IAU60_004796 [Kwoniella sp. DSM 27419]